MKRLALTCSVLAALAINPVVAAEHAHDHDGQAVQLQLNAGQKWETDAPLRQSMAAARQAVVAQLPAIHHKRLPLDGYRTVTYFGDGILNSLN